MNYGMIGFCAFGAVSIIFGIAHEYTWFKRRNGAITQGIILDNIEDNSGEGGPTYSPEIEFTYNGETRRFVSKYGDGKPLKIGKSVNLILSPAPHNPEVYTFGNRFLFTLIPIGAGLLFILIGIGIKP